MPVCFCDARPGGKIRYEWANGKGGSFYITGAFIALEPFSRQRVGRLYHNPASSGRSRRSPLGVNYRTWRSAPDMSAVNSITV